MLLGYYKRFAEPILLGTKVHTLRKPRKKPAKIGEQLHMYTGLRTSKCEVITKKEKLISIQRAWIRIDYYSPIKQFRLVICVDGRKLNDDEIEKFVRYDGFIDTKDFVAFWVRNNRHFGYVKLVSSLVLHHWTDLRY